MGLRDFFGGGGGKSKVAKHTKTTINPYTQSAERYHAMEQLLSIGAKDDSQMVEAYVGVLKRFTIASTKSIEDEEEKGWAYRRLSAIGKPLLPALENFCVESENIAWALRILEDVANAKEEWNILDKLVEKHPPGYERDPSKKIQMLTHLSEIDDAKVPDILRRYLEDDDETVRFFCVEALVDIGEESSCDALVGRLLDEKEDSLRLRGRVLDGLAELGWDVSKHTDGLAANLGGEHELRDGKIHRR
jgi:HEAT repeat protein